MFYDRYNELCEVKGVSPSKAALDNGISKTSVTRWKSGAMPNGDILITLADYFDVSTDYLLGRTKQKSTPQGDNALNGVPDEILEVLQAYASAAPEVKSGVRRFLGLRDPGVYEAIGEDMAKLISGVIKSNTKSDRKV